MFVSKFSSSCDNRVPSSSLNWSLTGRLLLPWGIAKKWFSQCINLYWEKIFLSFCYIADRSTWSIMLSLRSLFFLWYLFSVTNNDCALLPKIKINISECSGNLEKYTKVQSQNPSPYELAIFWKLLKLLKHLSGGHRYL